MKKLILSLLVCFAFIGATQAQVLSSDFYLYGTVTRSSDNSAVANKQVIIYEMNNTTILWQDTVLTNNSGFYGYTITNGSLVGPNRTYYAKVFDCQNFGNIQSAQNMQGTVDMAERNFQICDFNNTCQAGFDIIPNPNDPNNIYFSNTSTASNGQITSWQWSFGDGTGNSGPNLSANHTYTSPGVYTVCLTITTSTGCTSTTCQQVTIANPCQNAAGINNQSTPGGMAFFGYATWNNTIQNNATYVWNWGDGNTTTGGPTTQYQYSMPGTYNVCVTITYNGCTDDYCTQVTVGSSGGNCMVMMNPVAGNGPTYSFVSTGNGVGPIDYDYYVNGVQVSNGSATYAYQAPAYGPYYVCVVATDANGCVASACDSFAYVNLCDAGFISTPNGTNTLGFSPNQMQNGYNHSWTFGDGTSSTNADPIHTFPAPGWYYICHTVWNSGSGCQDAFCDSILVGGANTGCQAGFTYTITPNGGVEFTNTSDSNGNGAIVSYFWNFNDGTSSTQQNPSHQYNTFFGVACLTITTSNGCSSTICDTINFNNTGCNATFTVVPGNNLYTYYVTPAVAGGNWIGNYQPNPNGVITFPGPGVYNLCYVVVGSNGFTCDYCQNIVVDSVNIAPCNADFDWYYANNTQNTIIFDNNSNTGGVVATYSWSFGDGNWSSNANPDHHYQQAGWYFVCLTVTTANGCSSTFCDSVAVAPSSGNCQASFVTSFSGTPANGGTIYVFQSTSDPNLNHQWVVNGQQYTGNTVTHIFQQPGTYQVCLTVWNTNGCQDTECHSVFVTGDSTNTSPCVASFIYSAMPNNLLEYGFQSTADPNLNQIWTINGQTFTGLNVYYNFPGPGTYQVCLSVQGDSCYDSQCEVIYVGAQDSTVCNASFNYSAQNTGYHFTSTADHSLQHLWIVDNNYTYQGFDFTYQLDPGVHVICLTVSNNGCSDTECQTIVVSGNNPNCTSSISGNVTYSDVNCSICVNDAMALLYQLTPSDSGTVVTLVNVTLVSQGNYSFSGLCEGDYIVQAMVAPNSPNFTLYMPTYSFSEAQWYNSPVVHTGNSSSATADVELIRVTNTGGNGVLGGGINIPGDSVRATGPIQGVKVYATTPNGDYVAYTITDAMGNFTLGNLPYGTYTLCADYPGFITECQVFTVDANNPTINDIQFDFNHATVGIEEEQSNVAVGHIYPNPAGNEAFMNIELAKAEKVTLNVINTLGQVVYSQTLNLQAGQQLLSIPVNGLAAGMYAVTITGNNNTVSQKLLKY